MPNTRLCLAIACFLTAFNALGADEKENLSADRTPLLKQLDANGDGQLSADEVPDDKRRLFERLLRRGDANSDGRLSLEELTKALADEPRTPPPADGGDAFRRFLEAEPQEVFKRLDANGDGKMELSELPEPTRERMRQFMDEYDSNRDNALSLDEFSKGQRALRERFGLAPPPPPPVPGGLFRLLDTNGDGALSKEEIAAAPDSLRKLDTDGDGAISNRELMAVLTPSAGPAAAASNGNGRPALAAMLERLRSLDKNGDGKWNADELPPFLQRQFEKMDRNGDKTIDGEELKEALQRLRPPNQ